MDSSDEVGLLDNEPGINDFFTYTSCSYNSLALPPFVPHVSAKGVNKKRITRYATKSYIEYFALVSRFDQNYHMPPDWTT